MSTMLQQAGEMAGAQLKKVRWAVGLNGALSIAFGVVIIVWPNISLYSLVILFGAFALVRGIVGLGAAIAGPVPAGRGWLAFSSLISIVVGVVVFFDTGMSARALLYVIGAYAIALGVIVVSGVYWLPLDSGDGVLLSLTGLVSILFGVVMFAKPGEGALALLALIAAYALISGLAEVTVAIGGERLFKSGLKRYLAPASAQTSH
jgi:uncharacterized membrane protein HdeD (DUF308 family)